MPREITRQIPVPHFRGCEYLKILSITHCRFEITWSWTIPLGIRKRVMGWTVRTILKAGWRGLHLVLFVI